jgi:hypothetical protein
MSMTPENANTWRDLTDQLPPDQIAELEEKQHTLVEIGVSCPSN